MKTLYLVGDSTVSNFNDTTYYYPRYGYGSVIKKYVFDLEVVNLAMSGRSSKSFKREKNFNVLKENIKRNDFLIIGFGHNDEKYDDPIRFSSALGGIDDEGSFMYELNEYIKIAKNVGATPILCTPITRYSDTLNYDYFVHKNEYGDYRMAIIKLGELTNTEVIDLTKYTVDLYNDYKEKARYFHAIPLGKKENGKLTCDFISLDKTHLNIFGANVMAYYIVNTSKSLKKYSILELLPKESVLQVNPLYKYVDYEVPDLSKETYKYKDYYYTVFGDIGISIKDSGFIFIDNNEEFIMKQESTIPYGKICSTMEGFSYLFYQLSINDNFIMECNIDVLASVEQKDQAFGIMLRDDCYLHQQTSKELHLSNYVVSGVLNQDSTSHVIFSRSSFSSLDKGDNVYPNKFKKGDKCHLKLERLGQRITCGVIFNDMKYHNDFYDFDLTKVDNKHMYVGIFIAKGVSIKVTNLKFLNTGKSLGA